MSQAVTLPVSAGRITTADISRVLKPLLPKTHCALLFGSRATGRASDRSDWDIGILGPEPIDGAVLEQIRDALEQLPTLRWFDVVDLSTAPPQLRARAVREGLSLT